MPQIMQEESAFYARRTAGCPLEKLKDIDPNAGYKDYEETYRDKFVRVYIGKDYIKAKDMNW